MPRGRSIGIAAGAAALAVLAYGSLVEPRSLRAVAVEFPCDGIGDGAIRIALFSDVDAPGARAARERLLDAASRFDPDLILIAGDLVNETSAVLSPDALRATRDWLDRLPAPGRRFLAPGEQESPNLAALRESWPEATLHVLAGERRTLEVRGERLDLFVADRIPDAAPWSVDAEDGRRFAVAYGGTVWTRLATRDPVLPAGPFEFSLAFRVDDARAYLAIAGEDAPGSPGWRLVRYELRPAFRLAPLAVDRAEFSGKTLSTFDPPPGRWCRARVRAEPAAGGTTLRARFWIEGEEEPREWDVDAHVPGPAPRTLAFVGRAGTRAVADLVVASGAGTIFAERFERPETLSLRWEQPSRLAAWLAAPPAGARVVLVHDPDVVREIAGLPGTRPCLVLAGHTHGGQIRLPLLGPLHASTHIGRRYARGLHAWRGLPFLVTSGVGTSLLPIRIGVPPELVTLTLRPPAAATLASPSGGP